MAVTGSGAAVEIEILSSVSHINIIQYLESFDDDKVFYLVMEKFGTPWGGETLSDTLLVRHDLGSATLPDSTLLTVTNGSCATLFDFIDLFGYVPLHLHKVIFSQVASAVAHLHNQQIIHGDIKEENILLQSIGNGSYSVRLCDFGHARRIKRSQPGMKFYGTRDISPPELLTYMHECENGLDISANSCVSGYAQDIWALGMVLYTVIHGCLPANQEAYLNNQLDLSRQEFLPAAYDENIRRGSNVLTIDCLDILQKMLWIDPKKRITISQIMLHPWMNP